MLNILCLILVPSGIGLLLYLQFRSIWRNRQRTRDLPAVAEELGMTFNAKGNPRIAEAFSQFKVFNRPGFAGEFENTLFGGTVDWSLAITDFRFYGTPVYKAKLLQNPRQTIACVESPHLSLPDFELRPKKLSDKVAEAFGSEHIHFNSHPLFSDLYLLIGLDELAVRELFNSELLEFLEREEGISVEGDGDRLVYYKYGYHPRPEEIEQFLNDAFRVYEQFREASLKVWPGGQPEFPERHHSS